MTHGNTAAPEPSAGAQRASEEIGKTEAPAPEKGGTANEQHAASAPSAAVTRREHADEVAERFASQVAAVTAALGRGLLRFTSRVREEAEDIWAEAQDIRRGDKS
jgi:hypothetical protein